MLQQKMVEESADKLTWKTKDKKIGIKSLKELLDALINIKQENIDEEIDLNIQQLIRWLKKNFPKQLDLIANIKESLNEFTAQEMRELIIRKLRKII